MLDICQGQATHWRILYLTLPSSHSFLRRNVKNLFPGCNWLHARNCLSAPYFWAFPFPPQSLRMAEGEVFAQHFRASRIPSPWCVMNILLYCYVIYTKGSRLKAPSLHPLIMGSGAWSVLISRVFLLLYKQEHSALQLDVISGCLLMILKTD